MKQIKHILILLTAFCSLIGYGQISPGDLSASHAELEGMSNCTQCHEIGASVLSSKCLSCHTEIQNSIDIHKGFHAQQEVLDQDCVSCHSEHHGREFQMIRFDTINFDHSLMKFELLGKHQELDCKQCHQSDFIENPDLKDRTNTYMGLSADCLSCHEDYHQETLSQDCLSCHSMEGFDTAPNFDHTDTNYPLKGLHLEVDCVSCHQVGIQNGKEFQKFSGIEYNSCASCHEDVHLGNLPGDCSSCHTESGFQILKNGFNHNLTPFELKGSHLKTDCFACHQPDPNPAQVFQDQLNISTQDCVACHEDSHEPSLGNECAQCHNESSFRGNVDLTAFDHNRTNFPLEGLHQEVDCKNCHQNNTSDPLEFQNCFNCHEDYHQGEFNFVEGNLDCSSCHSVEDSFTESWYSIDEHQKSRFPLEGAHQATACFSCHYNTDENHWNFKSNDLTCVNCHLDYHNGLFEEEGFTDCSKCHTSENWNPSLFDHQQTRFALDGIHSTLDCAACHLDLQTGETIYKLNKTQCVDCHGL